MTKVQRASEIEDLFDQLEKLNQLELSHKLDNLLNKVYGLLMTFLSDELTPQQRQIWFTLAQQYPDPSAGVELARKIGSSELSKAVYKSILVLQEKNLIIIHQTHPRVMAIQANPDHPLTRLLIDFCEFYGESI